MPDGKYHDVTIAGFVLDPLVIPTSISAQVYGYLSYDTASWLENDEKKSHVSEPDLYYTSYLSSPTSVPTTRPRSRRLSPVCSATWPGSTRK